MCFAPVISITTAVIEFLLAAILLFYFPKSRLRNFFAVFIILLGAYQFSEYMLCAHGPAEFWAIVGIVVYSFLPAVGFHAVLRSFHKKFSLTFIYIIPVLASLVVIFVPGFVLSATCDQYFVNVATLATFDNSLLYLIPYYIYILYYAGFIIMSCVLMYRDFVKQRSELKRKIELAEISGVLLMTVPTFILLIVFPMWGVMFPSILCEFAIFVAIACFIGAYYESRLHRKK